MHTAQTTGTAIDTLAEYFPTCEMSVRSDGLNGTIALVTSHLMLVALGTAVAYQNALCSMPSLFIHEKRRYLMRLALGVAIMVTATVATHYMWAAMYTNIAFHNYHEFNYYEFDVDFNMHAYIARYLMATYLHVAVLVAAIWLPLDYGTRMCSLLLLIAALICINPLELLYYTSVHWFSRECRAVAYIFNRNIRN